MSPADFLGWRKHMRLSQRAAAMALGVSLPTLQAWERGSNFHTGKPVEIDRRTALACAALAAGIDSDKSWSEMPPVSNGMRPVHPGEVLLEDYLKPLNMTAETLAGELKTPELVQVAAQAAPISRDVAAKIVDRFGGDVASWMRLQDMYDTRKEEIDAASKK